jgi:hypothetical protein
MTFNVLDRCSACVAIADSRLDELCGLSVATDAMPRMPREAAMRPIEFFTWLLPSREIGTPAASRYMMTREQAAAYPGAVCIESSREVRMVPDSEADRHALGPGQIVAPKHEPPPQL